MQEVEEYEYEEMFTRGQLADFLENIAEQLRSGFELKIPTPIKKDGNIELTVSDLINLKISVRKRKLRSMITLSIYSEPTEITPKEEEEEEKEEKEE